MQLFYGISYYDRGRGNLPQLPVENMFVEPSVAEANPVLFSRPGFVRTGTFMGGGPIKALYQVDGVLSNALFGISRNGATPSLYEGSTVRGAIDGTGPARLAAFPSIVFANQGASVWKWDGASFGSVAMPGGFNVTTICVAADRLIALQAGTGKFWWSDVLSTTVGALSFATAENVSDNLKDCLYIGDTLILFGSRTVEFWPVTEDPDTPFAPLVGRTFSVGIRNTGAVTAYGNSFAWITENGKVCVGDPDTVVSEPWLQAKILAGTTPSLFNFYIDGTEYLAVRTATLIGRTFVYSSISKTWSEFTWNNTEFAPQCQVNSTFGGSINGALYTFATDYTDPVNETVTGFMPRRFVAGLPIDNGTLKVDNVTLRVNAGQTPGSTTNSDLVNLRYSRDGGNTWSSYLTVPLGFVGNSTRKIIQWRSLGFFSNPGVMFEFSHNIYAPFRVSGVTMNEKYGNI